MEDRHLVYYSIGKTCKKGAMGFKIFTRIISAFRNNATKLHLHSLEQRFSNYGRRTTSGPRGIPLWSFKKGRRKNKIQMNCVSHYS
jgi:hypothetical protein